MDKSEQDAERRKVIDKIAKLFAVAEHETANENEAMNAAEAAHALLAKYNISKEEISNKVSEMIRDNDLLTYFAGWIKPLFGEVARLNFCFYYYESFPTDFIKRAGFDKHARKLYVGSNSRTYLRHNFVGEEQNTIVARYMAEYLVSTMEKICRTEEKAWPRGERVTFRYSFMNACMLRLCGRLRERREKASQEGIHNEKTNLPALLSLYKQVENQAQDFLSNKGIKLGAPKKSLTRFQHEGGVKAGYKAGEDIGLDQQIDEKGGRITNAA